jgi:hypothetical protein
MLELGSVSVILIISFIILHFSNMIMLSEDNLIRSYKK